MRAYAYQLEFIYYWAAGRRISASFTAACFVSEHADCGCEGTLRSRDTSFEKRPCVIRSFLPQTQCSSSETLIKRSAPSSASSAAYFSVYRLRLRLAG